jgi:ABC-type Zn uptake system ZnuABC Zn-binding protein ZnuA
MKSEVRNPKSEASLKPEIQRAPAACASPGRTQPAANPRHSGRRTSGFGLRFSDLFRCPAFGLRISFALRLASFVIALLLLSSCSQSPPATGTRIATTTSYLEAAARDLLGDDLAVLRLAEPGTCPGHFDIRPSQVTDLRQCRALLRFDFQKSLDARLAAGSGTNGPRVAEIAIRGGMGLPESYLAACQQSADHFVALGLLSRTNADARLQAISSRLDALARESTNRVAQARLKGIPVIASGHQRDLCEWLGLKVVASFRAADTASISEIEEAIAAGQLASVKLVLANLPEGRRTADALGERLGAKVVVLENFPALAEGRVSFDQMLAANVRALTPIVAR